MDIQYTYSTEARQTAQTIIGGPAKKDFDHKPIDFLVEKAQVMGLGVPNVKGSKAELLQLLRDRAAVICSVTQREMEAHFKAQSRNGWLEENQREIERLRSGITKFAGDIQANPCPSTRADVPPSGDGADRRGGGVNREKLVKYLTSYVGKAQRFVLVDNPIAPGSSAGEVMIRSLELTGTATPRVGVNRRILLDAEDGAALDRRWLRSERTNRRGSYGAERVLKMLGEEAAIERGRADRRAEEAELLSRRRVHIAKLWRSGPAIGFHSLGRFISDTVEAFGEGPIADGARDVLARWRALSEVLDAEVEK